MMLGSCTACRAQQACRIVLPTRNLFRHGSFRDFHLYQACRIGPAGLDDILKAEVLKGSRRRRRRRRLLLPPPSYISKDLRIRT